MSITKSTQIDRSLFWDEFEDGSARLVDVATDEETVLTSKQVETLRNIFREVENDK